MKHTYIIIVVFIMAANALAVRNDNAVTVALAKPERTVKASWFGYDPADSTKALQAAIYSGAKEVVIDNVGEWVVEPIVLTNNQIITFEKGAVLTAKRGTFKGLNDSLLNLCGVSNVVIQGNGAILRMWKSDYFSPAYKRGEWRMGIAMRSAANVVISGLTVKDSGGDGIYIGNAGGSYAPYCRDIVIRDVVCDGNARQGISVISAENLLIENCAFLNTGGTAPEAGIDFEPNRADERLVNIVLRNCRAVGNRGGGFVAYLAQFNETTTNLSLTYDNCRASNNAGAGFSTSLWQGFEDFPGRTRIRMVNCSGEVGGSNATYNTEDYASTVMEETVKMKKGQRNDIIARVQPYSISGKVFVPFDSNSLPEKTVPPQLRDPFRCLLFARAGETAKFNVMFNRIGKADKKLVLEIVSPSGRKIAVEAALLGQNREYQFAAAETGTYTIAGDPSPCTAEISSPTHRMSFVAPLHIFGSTVSLYFMVPAGIKDFYARIRAQGGAEKVKATLCNPDGIKVNEQDNIAEYNFNLAASRDDASRDEVWLIKFEKPSDGSIIEDYWFSLYGVPQAVSSSKSSLLVPKPGRQSLAPVE